MTVGDAVASAAQDAPDTLRARMLAALGAGADEPEARTAEICIRAATELLAMLVRERRFERESAADLLTADALMTYAFEHASRTAGAEGLAALTRQAAAGIGETTTA